MKLLIIGQARHGKDTMAEILRDEMGVSFCSSSYFCLEKVVYPIVKDYLGYTSKEECYRDRVNHRPLWFELIRMYSYKDKARLTRELLAENDLYVGLRNREEFEAARDLFDHVIWVDATDRLGNTEDVNSLTMTRADADFVIYNNGSLEQFKESVVAFYESLEELHGYI